MRISRWIAAVAVVALAMSPAALAKNNKGGGPQGPKSSNKSNQAQGHGNSGFSVGEINLVRVFCVGNPIYRGTRLPPGIAKNYLRGKPLPPGIAKKVVPHDLLIQLPQRSGYTYYIVDDDITLVEIATGIVIDIIADVFR